jgi:hypothetical protein
MHFDASHELPDALLTLTTVDPDTSADAVNEGMHRIVEWLRRRYGKQVAYAAMAEWTTGLTRWSGGHRRFHLHVLVKFRCEGVDLAVVEPELARIWRHHTGATRIELAGLRTPGGVLGYLAGLHNTKQSQRPPAHLRRVRTFRASRNYWAQGREATVAAAHAEQVDRRMVHRARKQLGPDASAQLVELEVMAMKGAAANRTWVVAPIVQWVDDQGEHHVERRDVGGSDLRRHRRRYELAGEQRRPTLPGARVDPDDAPAERPLQRHDGQPDRTPDAPATRPDARAARAGEDAAACRSDLPATAPEGRSVGAVSRLTPVAKSHGRRLIE